MKSLLLILLLGACIYGAWDFYLAEHPLPQRTTLTDKHGRTVEVDITSVENQDVNFTLPGNRQSYTWPIADLNLVSKYKALRLRDNKAALALLKTEPAAVAEQAPSAAPAAASASPSAAAYATVSTPATTSTASTHASRDQTYANNMREQIADNNRKIDQLNRELSSPQLAASRARGIVTAKEREIQRNIAELEAKNQKIAAQLDALGR